jgi:hypothetical protein
MTDELFVTEDQLSTLRAMMCDADFEALLDHIERNVDEPEELAKNALGVELLEVPRVLRANDSDEDGPQTNDNGLTPLETGGYLAREDL